MVGSVGLYLIIRDMFIHYLLVHIAMKLDFLRGSHKKFLCWGLN
jgi:hypothetical protein